jgi:hypothetical protein
MALASAKSAADLAHQQHVAKLKRLSSLVPNKLKNNNPHHMTRQDEEKSDSGEEDPEEIAYRERLLSLTQETEDVNISKKIAENIHAKDLESAERAKDALRRTSSNASGLNWVAGQGKTLFVRSISGSDM